MSDSWPLTYARTLPKVVVHGDAAADARLR